MIVDGLKLIAGGDMTLTLTGDRKGAVLPDNPVAGDLFELETNEIQFGGIHEFDGVRWVLRNPLAQLLTYDISGTVFGSPEPGATVLLFAPPRSISIIAHESSAIGVSATPPTWDQEFIISVQRDNDMFFVGTILFKAGENVATFLPTNSITEVKRGDMLLVFAPSDVDPQFSNISLTLSGVLSL